MQDPHTLSPKWLDMYKIRGLQFNIFLFMASTRAFIYIFYFDAPTLTGLKLFLGCIAFGLFGGMLCFFSMKKRIMEYLKTLRVHVPFSPKRVFSVSSKMLFFMITVLLFMIVAILLMALWRGDSPS